jgi:sugar-specific transcriptional regulator TrmB
VAKEFPLLLDGKEMMPSTTNVLDEARDLVTKRLAELDDERNRLERALAELGGKASRRGPGRARGSKSSSTASTAKTKKAATPRRRRKRRGGTRADQAVSLIEGQPGISASDVAKTMKIKPNYLYRVLSDLEKEGRVKKDGRKYYPGG